ncbi:MAG: (Fe-S)-binding protein [Ignavibacteriales bacterium]
MNFRELSPVKEQIRKCVRCGRCRTVCPVFAEIKFETAAPRGHVFMVQMLRDGEVKPTEQVYEHLSNCLLCETCSTYCPSGIDIHELNEAARTFVYNNNPSVSKDLVFDSIWTRPGVLRTGSFFMGVANKTGMQKLARTLGLTKLLPGDLSKAEQIMQDPPLRSAKSSLPAVSKAVGQKKMTVAYFLGCGTDMFSPSVAKATVEVLTRYGCEVIIPSGMKCCGLPHIANGKMDTAQKLAIHNLKIFNAIEADYIVTDCASCSSALSQKRLELLLENEGYDNDIKKFCSRVRDLNMFLTDVLDIKPEGLKPMNMNVTYHDPCHLAKAQGIRKAPRDILKMVPGINLTEMAESDRCCGGSGTYSLTHYDMSMKILRRKMDNISKTGANVITTCCPSCTMQLKHGTNLYNYKAEVKHPVEILAEAGRK